MDSSKHHMLYLSGADISVLPLDMHDVVTALEQAFRLQAEGKAVGVPKSSIWIGPGHGFQSLSVVDTENGVAAMKWIGLVPPGSAPTANVNASILMSDTRTGEICCIMDAKRSTALRTAGMSALGARYLARPDSRSIGFIGSGVQAQSHLLAFASAFPSLKVARVHSAQASRAQGFADFACEAGLEAHVSTVDDVLVQSDIIVTTVPLYQGFQPFLDAARTRPGVFIAAIDLARPWIDPSLQIMDLTAVDEEPMKHAAKAGSLIPPLDHAAATLGDLVSGRHPGRTHGQQRIILVSSGSAVADLAIGRLIYRQALSGGIGQHLAR